MNKHPIYLDDVLIAKYIKEKFNKNIQEIYFLSTQFENKYYLKHSKEYYKSFYNHQFKYYDLKRLKTKQRYMEYCCYFNKY